jgi:hypothetical protein
MISRCTTRRLISATTALFLGAGLGVAPLHAVETKDPPKQAASAKKHSKKPATSRESRSPAATTGSPSYSAPRYPNDHDISNGY